MTPSSKHTHIVWDWNGTLLDDVWLSVEAMNTVRQRRAMPPLARDEYLEHFGFPVAAYYRRIGFDFDAEPFEIVGTEFIVEYERRRMECRLHQGAREALDRFRAAGLTQSILSASQTKSLRDIVTHFEIDGYFSDLVGLGDHYARAKTENGKQWLRESALAPGQVLMIGDTAHDHEVAQAMGVGCVLVTCGHQPRRKLEARGVELFDSLNEIAHNLCPTPPR